MPTFNRNDAFLDVARNRVPGLSLFHQVGFNFNVVDSLSTIWPEANERPMIPGFDQGSASVLSIASDNANDTASGTGLRTFIIRGLDQNLKQLDEIVTLTGTTAVLTTGQYRYINRFFGTTAGGSQTNIGKISATVSGTIVETIPTDSLRNPARSMSAVFGSPIDQAAYISKLEVENGIVSGADTTLGIDVIFRPLDVRSSPVLQGIDPSQVAFRQIQISVHRAIVGQGQHYRLEFDRGPQIPPGVAFEVVARRISGTGAIRASSSFDLIIVDEEVYNG